MGKPTQGLSKWALSYHISVHIAGICLFYEDSHFGSESHFMTSWVAQC